VKNPPARREDRLKRWKTTPTEPELACEPENPAATFRRKVPFPTLKKLEFEKLALFSASLKAATCIGYSVS
jgi:hypothetical protein